MPTLPHIARHQMTIGHFVVRKGVCPQGCRTSPIPVLLPASGGRGQRCVALHVYTCVCSVFAGKHTRQASTEISKFPRRPQGGTYTPASRVLCLPLSSRGGEDQRGCPSQAACRYCCSCPGCCRQESFPSRRPPTPSQRRPGRRKSWMSPSYFSSVVVTLLL